MSDAATITIADILDRAGGPPAILSAINRPGEKPKLTHWALYKWPSIGIPELHWPLIIRLAGVTAEELYRANVAARAAQKPAPETADAA